MWGGRKFGWNSLLRTEPRPWFHQVVKPSQRFSLLPGTVLLCVTVLVAPSETDNNGTTVTHQFIRRPGGELPVGSSGCAELQCAHSCARNTSCSRFRVNVGGTCLLLTEDDEENVTDFIKVRGGPCIGYQCGYGFLFIKKIVQQMVQKSLFSLHMLKNVYKGEQFCFVSSPASGSKYKFP